MSSDSNQLTPLVMLVITKADVGGAQMHVLQILDGLKSRYRFVLVTGEKGYLTEQAIGMGVRVVILPTLVRPIRPFTDITAIKELGKLITTYQPALVHAHSFKAGVVARIAARIRRVPAVFTAHGWSFTPGAPPAQRAIGLLVESVLCRLCQAVITVCQHDHTLASRWCVGPAKNRHLVRNAAAHSGLSGSSSTEPVNILSIGRLTPVKNHKLILQAMRMLPEEITLTIVGEGILRPEIEAMISQYSLTDRVELAGEVVDIEVCLGDAGLFVLQSNYEGLPLSVLEAMAAGLAVVSTNVGGVSEAVVDGETGILVPRGDARALAAAISSLLSDPARRKQMGAAARQRHGELFTTGRFVDKTAAIYQTLA